LVTASAQKKRAISEAFVEYPVAGRNT